MKMHIVNEDTINVVACTDENILNQWEIFCFRKITNERQ